MIIYEIIVGVLVYIIIGLLILLAAQGLFSINEPEESQHEAVPAIYFATVLIIIVIAISLIGVLV